MKRASVLVLLVIAVLVFGFFVLPVLLWPPMNEAINERERSPERLRARNTAAIGTRAVVVVTLTAETRATQTASVPPAP
jgi:hypothetical protein